MKTPLTAVAQWWRNWITTHANMASLDCCGPEEAERMAHDVGVSAPELRALAGKWPDSAELLNLRLAALELDPAEIRPSELPVLRDLQRVCTMCTNDRECDHDLVQKPFDPVWREYCPNVMTLDALTAERNRQAKAT